MVSQNSSLATVTYQHIFRCFQWSTWWAPDGLTLKSNVGARKRTARNVESRVDQARKRLDVGAVDLDTLDGGDGSCTRSDGLISVQVVQDSVEELVGHAKDNQGGVLDDIPEMRDGDQVSGQSNVGQVSRVLVSTVDDVGQFLAVDLEAQVSCLFLADTHTPENACRYDDLRASA